MEKLRKKTESIYRVINASTSGLRLFTASCLESVAEIPGPHAAKSQWLPTVLKVWDITHPLGGKVLLFSPSDEMCVDTKIAFGLFMGVTHFMWASKTWMTAHLHLFVPPHPPPSQGSTKPSKMKMVMFTFVYTFPTCYNMDGCQVVHCVELPQARYFTVASFIRHSNGIQFLAILNKPMLLLCWVSQDWIHSTLLSVAFSQLAPISEL